MGEHPWNIINSGVDEISLMQFYEHTFMNGKAKPFIENSSMKSRLLEGTSFGYGQL